LTHELWKSTPFSVKLLLLTSFMMNMGFYALIPYLTLHLTGSIGWTLTMAGLVLAVRQFSQQGFAFLGGVVADLFGYKGTMVLGMGIRATGFALFAFCTENWHFFLAAILSGLGGSLFEPAGAAAFSILTPESIRKEIFAFKNVLSNIGVVGSQIVGTVLSAVDFFWLSLFAGGLFYVSALLTLFCLTPLKASNIRGGIMHSIVHVLKDREFVRYTLILIGYYYLYMQLFLSIPKMVEDALRDKAAVGIVLASVSVFIVLFQMRVVRMLEGYEQRLTLIGIGTLVMGVGLFLFSFTDTLWLFVANAFLFALGTMISAPLLIDMVPRFAPKELTGAYFGFNGYSLAIGGSIGQVAGGWVYDLGHMLAWHWLPWTICLAIGMLVAWNLHRMEAKLRVRAPQESL
jgi:DHA1 family multidrug resistance protein-like MFS transporter